MNFQKCVEYCLGEKELVSEFNRLSGCKLGIDNRSPIEMMIDEATGFDEQREYIKKFMSFVFQYIWLPLLPPNQGSPAD